MDWARISDDSGEYLRNIMQLTMLEAVLLDNDVILKMCAYASAARLLQVTTLADQPPRSEVASFALRSQVQRSRSISDKEGGNAVGVGVVKCTRWNQLNKRSVWRPTRKSRPSSVR